MKVSTPEPSEMSHEEGMVCHRARYALMSIFQGIGVVCFQELVFLPNTNSILLACQKQLAPVNTPLTRRSIAQLVPTALMY